MEHSPTSPKTSPHDARQLPTDIAGPSYEDLLRKDNISLPQRDSNEGVLDAESSASPTSLANPSHYQPQPSTVHSYKLKKSKPLEAVFTATSFTAPTLTSSKMTEKQKKEADREKMLENLNVLRNPPSTPSLLPAHRYCHTDKIVKPFRAHHCRVCGTVSRTLFVDFGVAANEFTQCVLRYDHHCPCMSIFSPCAYV